MPTQQQLILAGGCFWCLDPIYHRLKGVLAVESGYCGGHVAHPTYEQVCTGRTGHAEALRITYDPAVVSRDTLLDLFFTFHDPTTLDRQGNDIGTQYRSALFYRDADEQAAFAATIARIEAAGWWSAPIVTRLEPMATWYPAEDYHQRYFETHGHEPFCAAIIAPKVRKLRARFSALLSAPDA